MTNKTANTTNHPFLCIATQQRLERIEDCLYGIKMTARVLELDMLEDLEEENPKSLGEYIKGGLIAAIRQLSYSANNDLSMIRDSMHEDFRTMSNEATKEVNDGH